MVCGDESGQKKTNSSSVSPYNDECCMFGYLAGQRDVASKSINHIAPLVVPLINRLTKPRDPPSMEATL